VFEFLFTHPSWAYRTGTFAFASAWPLWLLIALILVGVAVIVASLWTRRSLGMRLLLPVAALQIVFMATLVVLLWRPVLNVERVRDRENVLAVAIDASASMAQADELEGDSQRSRLQTAVEAFRGDALEPLSQAFELRVFSFADRVTALPAIEEVPAPGSQTRIGDAITHIVQQAASLPLAAVVLISDGAENAETLTEERLAEIASFGIPVHTVGVGPEVTRNDLELERVEVPRIAPQAATITANLGIRHQGVASTRVRVYDRDTLIATREIDLDENARLTQFSLDLPSGNPSTRELRFVLDQAPGERNLINNERTRIVEVPAERRSILYVEGEPRWEFKFLRRAATSDRALRLASVVRTTPNKFYRQGVASPEELRDGFPNTAEKLFGYEAVVIGSYEASNLSAEQHRLLTEFIDRRGGSVLMLAGRYGLSAGGWQNTALAQTLPVRLPSSSPNGFVQRTAKVAVTSYGAGSAITRLDADTKRNAERWRDLPALADYQNLGRLKPGAIVLLEAASERGRAPLLAWQHYGQGAAFVLGTASTLRWQMRLPPEDQSHETFWRQLLHALVAQAPAPVSLSSERGTYDDERRVQFQAEIRNGRFEPISDAQVELMIAPERDAPLTQIMQASGHNDGRYVATIDAATSGVYRASIVARQGGNEVGRAVTHVIRNDGVAEQFATHQHRAVLERIAEMTGGRYWTLDQLSGLASAIPYSKAGVIERLSLDLWNLPIVFLFLLALKLAEWGVRLKWGRI
jgi:uncharacterized membrane protein